MTSSWIRKGRRVGPITEQELLTRIDKGKILPETLLQSSKTKEKWVPMKAIGPAMARWKKIHPDKASQP
jgi:hypothetical protein